MDEDKHKGTEAQRDKAEGFLCSVPLHLCHFVPFFFVPMCLCIFVPDS